MSLWLLTPKHKVRPMVRTGEEKWKWAINIKWQSQHNGTNSQFDSILIIKFVFPSNPLPFRYHFLKVSKKSNENINLRFECAQFCTSLSTAMRWMIWCNDKIRCLMERVSEIGVYSKFSLFFYNIHIHIPNPNRKQTIFGNFYGARFVDFFLSFDSFIISSKSEI